MLAVEIGEARRNRLRDGDRAGIGERAGPGFSADEVVPAIERLVEAYLDERQDTEETFLEVFRRVGMAPFKAALYPAQEARSNAA